MASSGCIYVPNLSVKFKSSDVGETGEVPFKVGQARRDKFLKSWGDPTFRSVHDRAFGYVFYPVVGYWVGLIPGACHGTAFRSISSDETDDVWLEFDVNGILKRYEKGIVDTRRGENYWAGDTWKRFLKNVPDEPRPQ